MTTADPAAFDPDDERLSRFLDDDLDVEEAAARLAELGGRPGAAKPACSCSGRSGTTSVLSPRPRTMLSTP
ncbi:MAG: hypothetical protein R2749_27355 [Acidimicrobiales bacterium]